MSEDDERPLLRDPSSQGKEDETPTAGSGRRGPRSLVLKRAEGGFGFTLRHFIVYPPESYTMLGGNARGDGPMDTIFVKWVRPGSPAAAAGLSNGDRLIQVNGEPTAGRTYAHVVRLIQQSPNILHLLVVPKEEDVIQRYFSETAHNPETNQRPMRDPHLSSSSQQRAPSQVGSENEGCHLSLDAASRRGSQDTHSSDDSLIMNRIRKSLEKKEEFLRRPVAATREYYNMRPGKLQAPHWPPAIPASSVNTRGPECSSPADSSQQTPSNTPCQIEKQNSTQEQSPSQQPNSLEQTPPQQPNLSQSSTNLNSFLYGGPVTNAPGLVDERLRLTSRRPVRELLSPPNPNTHQLRLVSERARQFETGLLLADRTDLYRSELARLSSKKNVPNVAVRRKEFENRCDWRKRRESRSLDNNTAVPPLHQRSLSPSIVSSNRTIPIGSTKIHCDPPPDYKEFIQPSPERKPIERPRSNSAEGVWGEKDPPHRHRAVRQDSYLAAVNKPFTDDDSQPEILVTAATPKKAVKRPDTLHLTHTNSPAAAAERSLRLTPESRSLDSSPSLEPPVHRRNKSHPNEDIGSEEDEKTTRRMSYLKATWGGRLNLDPSDVELSDTEPSFPSPHKSVFDIPPKDLDVVIEGVLYCKVTQVDGKRAPDRSWRQVWGVVRGPTLYLFKDKKDSTSETPVDHERIDLGTSTATAAEDYTKRRHVIRLSTPNISEILLQAESQHDMARWLTAMGGVPHESPSPVAGRNVSPSTQHKGIMKLTNTFRNRSPTGQSPVNKTRKPSQSELIVPSTKSRTWKGMVAKQLRRIQAGSPVSPTAPPSYPEGATIGVPLELCPPSPNNEFVPMLVEHCTQIVEERGLEIIGIYRVPGNTGAVSSLTEAVNRGLDAALQDQEQRWTDVNVISSLLKLFFRNLPDCLLTNDHYPMFIEADKISDPQKRILKIRELVNKLPPHHFETLKHLMRHLKLVVENSHINKMEARNLAIVFGPTLLRAGDDNMVTMVTDMSHQCRVVESLIIHADWCFSEEGPESLLLDENHSADNQSTAENEANQQSLLLGNVHKLGGMKGEVSRRDIVSSIITAANRKMMKSKTRKSLPSASLSHDDTSPNDAHKLRAAKSSASPVLIEQEIASSPKGDKKDVCVNRRKESDPGEVKSVANAIACGVRGSILFPGGSLQSYDKECSGSSEERADESDGKQSPKQEKPAVEPTNDGTIVTYTGLSETTQERIRKFELETKAMLQRDRNKEWVRIAPQNTPPSAIADKIAVTEGAGLAKWKQITSPQSFHDPLKPLSSDKGSLESLTEPNNNNSTNNNNADSVADLVSTLTDTFDAKMKSLGLLSVGSANDHQPLPSLSFRDPSLHRSFTSPNLEMKVLEDCIDSKETCKESEKEKENEEKDSERDKVEVEKDNEKENFADCYEEKENCSVRLKRSESFKQREEKKDPGVKLLRRAESLNKKECKSIVLRRSESLTKTEKTDLNQQRRKQCLESAGKGKMKRKTGGGSERSIKRRHTVGGTKDFDKTTWLDNREREAAEERPERRTSSPDLVSTVNQPLPAVVVWGAPRL